MSEATTRQTCRPAAADLHELMHITAVALAVGVGGLLLLGCGPRPTSHAEHAGCADAHGATADACATRESACADAHGATADACAGAAAATDAAHDHDHGEDEATDDHGAGHGGHAHPELSPEAIATRRCEHEVPVADCDECRYEVGLVKLPRNTAEALLKTTTAEQGTVAHRLRLTGEVALDATAVVDVLPAAPGSVIRVSARLGQPVQAGDVLAVIHSSEVGEAKATYLEALTAAEIAVQERDRQRQVSAALGRLLDALPTGAGQNLAKGEPLGEWKSRLLGAAAHLAQARSVCDRETALVEKNASSKAELESARRELQTAEADYAALVEEAQMSLKLELLRAENAARQAEARLAAAEQRLHFFGLDEAAFGRIRAMQDNGSFADLTITAPRSGTITALSVTEGRYLEATESLCTIADLTNLWVWCDLYERDLAVLHEALRERGRAPAQVRVAAFPEASRGEVDLLGHDVNEATRTVKVRVQVPAHEGRLRPGMFATVEVELPGRQTATLVPRDAVLSDEGDHFVFRHWRDDLWLQRKVVLGASDGRQVEIVSGLEPGAEVVVSGGFMLKSDVLREKMGAGCAD